MKKKTAYFFFSVIITMFLFLFSLTSIYAAEDFELFIAQGIQKLNEEKYSEALELLKRALEISPDDPEAIYYSAIAYSRLGELGQAEKLLLKVKKEDKHVANVYFELGRIYYARGDCRKAEDNLKQFIAISEDTASKNYADSLIKDCYGRAKEKPYKVNLTAGFQYDTNVVLEPNNPSVTADRKRDGRAVALITAGARLYENRTVRIKADYNLYQSLHANLGNFNVHYQKISPSIELTVSDFIKPSAGYSFEYIIFGGESYGKIKTLFLNANIKETVNFSTDVIYEHRHYHYWDTDEFESNSDRTGRKNTAGLKQNFTINKLKGDIHYFYDNKRAEEDHWAYIGNRIGAVAVYSITTPLRIKVSAEYDSRRHKDDFPTYGETREDEMQKYAVSLQYSLSSKMTITLMESYTKNDSNIEDFEYRRNIVGILLTYGLI